MLCLCEDEDDEEYEGPLEKTKYFQNGPEC